MRKDALIYLFSTDSPLRSMTGDFERMALYAGQGVDKIDAIVPAGERLKAIISEATRLLQPISGWREVGFGSLATSRKRGPSPLCANS